MQSKRANTLSSAQAGSAKDLSFFDSKDPEEDETMDKFNNKSSLNRILGQYAATSLAEKNNHLLSCESVLVATNVLQSILARGEEKLLEKKLAGKMKLHQIARTSNLWELFLKQQYLYHDKDSAEPFVTDEEPPVTQREFRRAFDMPSCKAGSYQPVFDSRPLHSSPYSQADDLLLMRSQSMSVFSLHAASQQQESASEIDTQDNLDERIKRDVIRYKMIDLTPKQELDTYIETLRILKQREQDNMREQERLKQEREAQLREHRKQMQKLSYLHNPDSFTFDYDGTVIIQKVPADIEYQNATLTAGKVQLEHKIRNPNEEQGVKKNGSSALEKIREELHSSQIRQNSIEQKTAEEEEEEDDEDAEDDDEGRPKKYEYVYVPLDPKNPFGKKVKKRRRKKSPKKKGPPLPPMRKGPDYSNQVDIAIGWVPPNVMEKFQMADGVTLKERHSMVSGQAIEAPVDLRTNALQDEESLLLQNAADRKQKIRMTKQQYQQWVQNSSVSGNYKQQTEQSLNSSKGHRLNLQSMMSGGPRSESGDDLGSFLFSQQNRQKFQALSERIVHKSFKDLRQPDGGSIQVHRTGVLVDDELLPSSKHSSRGESFLNAPLSQKQRNIFIGDKKSFLSHTPNAADEFNSRLIKGARTSAQKYSTDHLTLSTQEKLPPIFSPKPQTPIHRIPKTKTSSFSRLPAPKIGHTLGHSILQGVNPEDPHTFVEILDRMVNQSLDAQRLQNANSMTSILPI